MRKVFAGLILLVALLVVLALPAGALQTTLVVELGDTIEGDPGSIHTVYDEPTPTDMIGLTCGASVTAVNNESIHPNNDMIITSGSSSATIFNYESIVNGTTQADSDITLGDTILIQVQLGDDGITSEVFDVTFTCAQPPPPTTTTTTTVPPPTTTPTTAPPPTTSPPTTGAPSGSTTTESPPSGGVEAGGGGTAGNAAAPWVGGGALLLAAALATAAAGRALAARKN